MNIEYRDLSKLFKALSDPTRLRILDMISCSPMCACDILEKVEIGQSTLSYHMKILVESNLVKAEAKGSWTWYTSNIKQIEEMSKFLNLVSKERDSCICNLDDINKE